MFTKFLKLEKIVVNCVTKDCVVNSKVVDSIKGDLAAITGQKAVTAKAKKSIATFKVREGHATWCCCYSSWRKNVRVLR